jgi:mutator protein MutT
MDIKPLFVTLCYIRDNNKLLLALKKRGFGPGKWNGYGGKIEEGETIEQAAIRETKEESGVDIIKLERRASLTFSWFNNINRPIKCYVFMISEYSGQVIETEEMKPQWFEIDNLPYENMWDGDPYWLPHFLDGKTFTADFMLNDDDSILNYSLKKTKQPF